MFFCFFSKRWSKTMIVSLQLLPCNQQIFLISLSSHTYSRYTKARSQFALHHLQCESLRATCLLCPPFFFFFFFLRSSEPCSMSWYPRNWDHSHRPGGMLHPLSRNSSSQDSSPFKTECGPRVCDNRVRDGNAGPFGPPKPGVSTSAHCLINNWQRQTNQNNLLPTAKC